VSELEVAQLGRSELKVECAPAGAQPGAAHLELTRCSDLPVAPEQSAAHAVGADLVGFALEDKLKVGRTNLT